jgi:hypothetical protein
MAITPPIRQMTLVANRTTVAGAGQWKPGDAAGPASLVLGVYVLRRGIVACRP